MDGQMNNQGGVQMQMGMPQGVPMDQQQQMMQGQMMGGQPMQMMQQQPMMGGMPQMGGQPIGGYGSQGFAARPQVVKQKKFRDPYREYVKVAPQNIMYDRRVVRGNTFAALVIPVNMQPDPALIEKQKMEEAYMKQRQEEMRIRRHQEKMRQQAMQENQNTMQMQQMQSANVWEELNDEHNFVNERMIEPDYFIDNPPDAVYIPNPKGDEKTTQIFDGDKDLMDYENEVEPILQVLVGKSIEHARIEVIEEWEKKQLDKNKREWLQLKEAELMETQRHEGARDRRNDEMDRRNLQMRTAKSTMTEDDKKVVARRFAKNFLALFKRDTLKIMVDEGALRKPVDLSIGATYVPQLYNQIQFDMQTHRDHQDQMDDILNDSMASISLLHKQSIVREQNKRQEARKKQMEKEREEEQERNKRRKIRQAKREKKRIGGLQKSILDDIVGSARNEEYNIKMKVYDVRNSQTADDGIILIGGIVAELCITFSVLIDYIQANPSSQGFMFTKDMIMQYLTDLLSNDDNAYPDNFIQLNLSKSLEQVSAGRELALHQVIKICQDKQNNADFGLNFFFESSKDLMINDKVINAIYEAICQVATEKPKDLLEVPEDPDAAEKATAENEAIEKSNAKLAKMKSKICIVHQEESKAYNEQEEQALVKLSNYKEPGSAEAATARTGGSAEDGASPEQEQFDPSKLSTKIPIIKPRTDSGIQVCGYHCEAPYAIRKTLIEQAKKTFKDKDVGLDKADVVALLSHSANRSRMLDERFEEMFIKTQDYNRGCQYTDINTKVTYKTFLSE